MTRRLPRRLLNARSWSGFALALAVFAAVAAYEEFGHRLLPAEAAAAAIYVHDGDTIRIAGERIRIMGLDTPEIGKGARCAEEARAAAAAKAALQQLLSRGEVTVARTGTDRYGRTLAYVYVDGRDVAKLLIDAGLARPYDGGRRDGWCG